MMSLADVAAASRVLVVGSLNMDLIIQADSEPEDDGAVTAHAATSTPGGHAGNCATALAKLGLNVTIAACVGADADGDVLINDLRAQGVDTRGIVHRSQQPTGRAFIPVFPHKHYMLLHRGANELMTEADVADVLSGHFDAVMLFDPSPEALVAVARLTGQLDPRPLLCWTPGGVYAESPIASQVVSHCDILMLNQDERVRIARADAKIGAVPEIVTTMGARGATLDESGAQWSAPAMAVDAVDPTGAGDAFAAGYLLARLAKLSPIDRLRVGNVTGALAVTVVGARGRLATLSDLQGLQEVSGRI